MNASFGVGRSPRPPHLGLDVLHSLAVVVCPLFRSTPACTGQLVRTCGCGIQLFLKHAPPLRTYAPVLISYVPVVARAGRRTAHPWSFVNRSLAPLARRAAAACEWPFHAARCSGVSLQRLPSRKPAEHRPAAGGISPSDGLHADRRLVLQEELDCSGMPGRRREVQRRIAFPAQTAVARSSTVPTKMRAETGRRLGNEEPLSDMIRRV